MDIVTGSLLSVFVFCIFFAPWQLRKTLGRPKRIWPLQILGFVTIVGYFAVIASRAFVGQSYFWGAVYDFLGLLFMFQLYWYLFSLVAILATTALAKLSPGGLGKPTLASKGVACFGLALCLGLVSFGTFKARGFIVTEFEVALPGLEKPVTVAHIPDLHLGASRGKAYLESVLEAVKQESPDIVWYNGDLVDSRLALRDEVFGLFKEVSAEQYFTTGNHEYYVGVDEVIEWAKNSGIKVLRSELAVTHGIQFIGLEYMNADRESSDAHQVNQLAMDEELPKIGRGDQLPVVVAHHSPVGLKYVEGGGAAAMLSGHTHGGQVFPGTLIIRTRFPMYKGRYQFGKTALIVSQGAGTFGPMMRLETENEIQVVKFVPAAK